MPNSVTAIESVTLSWFGRRAAKKKSTGNAAAKASRMLKAVPK